MAAVKKDAKKPVLKMSVFITSKKIVLTPIEYIRVKKK
jgi:hypothetical protein